MTAKTALRKFTDNGIEQFRRYLAALRAGGTARPPLDLLTDPDTSRPFHDGVRIKARRFGTRLQLARYLHDLFFAVDSESIETDVPLWSWLSLFYFDQVCPADEKGRRKPGRDYRHILEPGYPNGHRHLLCGPYLVYTVYGLGEELSRLPLCTPLPVENTFHHQLAARQGLITNRGVMEAVHNLYYEAAAHKPKHGSQVKRLAPGSFFRFISIIQQLDLNYDLYSMTGDEVIDLLPPEFNRWKTPAGTPRKIKST